jgi:hypothetical protein
MTTPPQNKTADGGSGLIGLVDEMTAAASLGQAIALGLMQASGTALAGASGSTPRDAGEVARIDAEVEAGFDNMPI